MIGNSLSHSHATVVAGWIAAGTALLGAVAPGPAQAAAFTEQECKVIAGVTGEVIRAVGKEKLSVDFRKSIVTFIAPDGKRATCDGPTNIATPTIDDSAAYNTIRGILLQGPNPISLQKRGLVSVASPAPN